MVGVWLMMRARDLKSSTFELVMSQVVGGIGGGFTTIAVQIGCQGVVEHQGACLLLWLIEVFGFASLTALLLLLQTSPSRRPSSSPSPKSAEPSADPSPALCGRLRSQVGSSVT